MKVTRNFLMLLFTTSCIAMPFKLPALRQRADLEAETDQLLFDTSMSDFIKARDAKDPPELNWTSNGCSDSPDNPLGFNFEHSCNRHDFGYRNYKAQDRFSDSNKDKIDSNFKSDMYDECATHHSLSKDLCDGVADLYYEAVSNLANKRAIEPDMAEVRH